MDYFREKLLMYDTQRQISTLLHIHVETDRVRPMFPASKTKSYVDQVLNQYTVNMCSYPDLTPSDSKLAFNIYNQRKSDCNIFHLEEFKRKPLKKKISKKSVNSSMPADNFKICPCCDVKVFSKHKCDHTLCQKPCARIKRFKLVGNQQGSHWKKRAQDQQEQFSPDRDQLDNEQSKYSNSVQRESDFSEQLDIQELEQSQSYLSNIEKGRRGKSRRKIMKNQPGRKRSRKSRNPNRRSTKNQNKNEEQEQKVAVLGQKAGAKTQEKKNQAPIQLLDNPKNQVKVQAQTKQQVKKTTQRRRKGVTNKAAKKISTPSENVQSQFQPQEQTPKKDGRRKKGTKNQQKANNQNPYDVINFKKKQSLAYFCTLQQLRSNQYFSYYFHFEAEPAALPPQKELQQDQNAEQQKQKQENLEPRMQMVEHKAQEIADLDVDVDKIFEEPELLSQQNQICENEVENNFFQNNQVGNQKNKQAQVNVAMNSMIDVELNQEEEEDAEYLFEDQIVQQQQ